MVNDGFQAPSKNTENDQDSREKGDTCHDVLEHFIGTRFRIELSLNIDRALTHEETWIVYDFRMLRQKGRKVWVWRKKRLIGQERRIQLKNLSERWRILL